MHISISIDYHICHMTICIYIYILYIHAYRYMFTFMCVCVLISPIPNISLYMNSSNIKMDYINAWVIFNVTAIAWATGSTAVGATGPNVRCCPICAVLGAGWVSSVARLRICRFASITISLWNSQFNGHVHANMLRMAYASFSDKLIWLVVWIIWIIFSIYKIFKNNNPNWLSYVSEG